MLTKVIFFRIYPTDKKSKAGDALRLFCQDFGVPEHLTFDSSKEQCSKGITFMKQILSHNINYHICEADLHNKNLVEGVILELSRKWYQVMICNKVPKQFWDYGLQWVSKTSSLTHTSVGNITGNIPFTSVTGETADLLEYLDFGFYDRVWFKDIASISSFEPARWLGVSHPIGRLMCYHVLTQRVTVVSRSTVQQVMNIG